jgi:protein-disulfide isomerase
MTAHRAAIAAAAQGAFWQMHDMLYEQQDRWAGFTNAADVMESFATDLGLDVEQFKADRDSSATFDRIDIDVESAKIYSINATPTVIINGLKVEQTPSYDDLRSLIDAELAKLEAGS